MSKKRSVFAPLLTGAGIGILINLIRDGSLTGDTGSRAPRPFSNALERGILIDGVLTLPAKTEWIDNHTFKIILREGRKHQIRRMCEALRLTVTRLSRLRIGPITIGKMKPGEFRVLSAKEVGLLKK